MKTMQQLYEDSQLTIDDLAGVRRTLKAEIEQQQAQMFNSARRLVPFTKDSTTINLNKRSLSPLSILSLPLRTGKAFTIVEGVLTGFRLVRGVRRLLKR